MTATATAPKERVTNLLSAMEFVSLSADDPAVERMASEYRTRYGLPPRDPASERAEAWHGMARDGRVVAVMGDRRRERTIEITDAYFDGTVVGKAAFAAMAYAYRALLQDGGCDELVHTILYENEAHWRAIIRETGDAPYLLVFRHRRKGAQP